jgi:hypothetical protein
MAFSVPGRARLCCPIPGLGLEIPAETGQLKAGGNLARHEVILEFA